MAVDRLYRKGLVLEYLTVGYNVAEAEERLARDWRGGA